MSIAKYGIRFGYPICCINAFIIRHNHNIDNPDKYIHISRIQNRISRGSGFIPCSFCCWKVLSGKCKLEDLIKNRKDRSVFPNQRIKRHFFFGKSKIRKMKNNKK